MYFELVRMSFESLISNKVRSFLSILGIIIGVSTVIIVVGIGLGAQQSIEEQYKNLSVTSIIINPINITATAPVAPEIIPGLPPKTEVTNPIINAAYNPVSGDKPAIMAKATASGTRAKATVSPERTSSL